MDLIIFPLLKKLKNQKKKFLLKILGILENQNIENNNSNIQNETIKEENIGTKIVENAIKEINEKIDEEINETIAQVNENNENNFNNSNKIIDNSEVNSNIKEISIEKNNVKVEESVNEDIIEKTNENINEENIKEINESTNENNIEENTDNNNHSDFEKMFDELLNSILQINETENNINSDIDLENGFGLQAIDEIKEIDITDFDDNILNDICKEETSNNSEIENLLNDFSENAKEESKENVNNLKNNDGNFQISELPTLKEDSSEDFFDKFIDASCNFLQNVWNGCKKIGSLIKQKAKNLLSEEK